MKAHAVQTQSCRGTNLEFLGKRKVGKTGIDEGIGKKMCNSCKNSGEGKFTLIDEDIMGTKSGLGMAAAVADRNEHDELELSGAWEPLDSSRPLPNSKGKQT